MQNSHHSLRKKICIAGASFIASIGICSPVMADQMDVNAINAMYQDPNTPNGNYLKEIANYTNAIMQYVNTSLNTFITNAGPLVLSWMAFDQSASTSNLQGNFTIVGSTLNQDTVDQLNLQSRLNTDLLSGTGYQYPNDITFSTLLGAYPTLDPRNPPPQGQPKVDPGYNYIKNASGINFTHLAPPTSGGPAYSRKVYSDYYNSIMSVESYNGYLLSNLYAEYANKHQLSTAQTALVNQVTAGGSSGNPSWIATVATEPLGIVLRQILMFVSQSYVLTTELVKVEKQMVAAQAMTNTLLILNMQSTESLLYGQAKGFMPSQNK